MRFKLGLSYEEKEKIREAKKEWHGWFAWHPVRLGSPSYWAWFENIQRKAYEGTTGMTEPPFLCFNYKEHDPLVRFLNKDEIIK